jgi:hypothetical protein
LQWKKERNVMIAGGTKTDVKGTHQMEVTRIAMTGTAIGKGMHIRILGKVRVPTQVLH